MLLLLLLLLFYRPFTSEFSSPSLRLRSVCLDIFWSSSVLHLSAPLLPLHISLCLHQRLYLPLSVFITWNITSLSCCKCFSPLNHSSISAPLSPLTSSSPSFRHVSVFFSSVSLFSAPLFVSSPFVTLYVKNVLNFHPGLSLPCAANSATAAAAACACHACQRVSVVAQFSTAFG